jgi:hypothetical protein
MAALSPSATIIIVLVCCACLVVVIAALGRHYRGDIKDEEANYKISPDQATYMRSVKQRNVEAIMPKNHRFRESEKPKLTSSLTYGSDY